ncbi:MAG: hypothetical protein Q8K97_05240 [Pseudohongiella sp.]|nr:hypothetical protein [Pseudohongiella sp.]
MTPKRIALLLALIIISVFASFLNYQVNRGKEDLIPAPAAGEVASESISTNSTDLDGDFILVPSLQSAAGQDVTELAEESVDNPPQPDEPASRSSAPSSGLSSRQPTSLEPVLSSRVYAIIEEVQRRQSEGHWEEALNELNALYTDFESMNSYEQATVLNFYTNTLLHLEMWQESISAFSLLLTVDNLRPDSNARALLSLGQLHAGVGEIDVATAYYEEWLEFTRSMSGFDAQTELVQQQLNRLREL